MQPKVQVQGMLGLDENHRARVKWEDECRNSQLKQDLISASLQAPFVISWCVSFVTPAESQTPTSGIFNQAGQTFFQLIRSGEAWARAGGRRVLP